MARIRKVCLLLAVATLAMALTACGGGQSSGQNTSASSGAESGSSGATKGPEISIVGAYYGDLGSDDTYQDLCIVFDFINDDANRKMPTSGNDITIKINDSNVYTVAENETHKFSSTTTGSYEVKTFDYTERYTGYRYPVGYGDILGGSEPVRMFVSTLFNPNDLKSGETITLTIGDVSGEFPVSKATEITIADEIMKAEPDFETAQILAAEKWRLDTAAEVCKALTKDLGKLGGGDWASGYSQSMKNHFSPASGGVSVFEEPGAGFKQETHTFNTVVDKLPAYDHDTVVKGYPEVANLIDSFESQWLALSDSILVEGTDKEAYAERITGLLDTYHQICDTLSIGTVKNL